MDSIRLNTGADHTEDALVVDGENPCEPDKQNGPIRT